MLSDIHIVTACPSPEDFCRLRSETDWGEVNLSTAQNALQNSLCGVSAYKEKSLIGMTRAVGDGVMNIYIQDMVVSAPFRGLGLGRQLLRELLQHLKNISPLDCTIGLMSAKGQEHFYRSFGFIERPTTKFGAGMIAALGDLS